MVQSYLQQKARSLPLHVWGGGGGGHPRSHMSPPTADASAPLFLRMS